MSLSPNVTPFVPRHQSVVPSQQTNVFRDSKWKLSADVAEFVPGRLKNGSTLPKNPTSIISATTVTENTEPLIVVPPSNMGTDGQSVPKNISNVNSSKPTPKTYSFKTDSTANLSKKKFSLLKPDHHKTMKEDIPTKSNYDKNDIESDFPALGTSTEKTKTPRTVWSQPFGMSFSEKLKSKNASSYFYEEPPRLCDDKPLKEEQRPTTNSTGNENKAMKKHIEGDRLNSIKLDSVLNKNTESKNIAQPQSDDEGFSIVKKSNKSRKTMSVAKDEKTSGRRRIPLDENLSDDNTKERTKGVVRFSESRSKTSDRQRPTRERLSGDMQKHSRSSNSANWRSGKNITEKEKEPRGNDTLHDGGRSRTRQSFEPTKNYYALKSTHGVLENKNVNLKQNDDRNREKNAGNIHKNISPDIATVETRAPLSYSDILKSKPSQVQLPDSEKVDGKEKGVLTIPSEASEDDEMDGEKMEEQEGKTKKKKKKKKKKSTTDVTPQPVKKSKEMLTLDFGDMLTKMMESSATKKKPVIRTGGFLPAQAPLPPKETRTTKKPDITYTKQGANFLDSTAPIVFRSKEREFPKKRKPSAMRKILMKEREEKQMIREGRSKPEESLDAENSENESSERRHSDSDEIDPAEVKKAIHSRKFREYCDQDLDYEINGVVIQLLKELIRFQDRQFHKDPIKAKAKRRFVCGLREVYKHAKLKKLKCVIVTPNLEPTKSKGGLDDLLSNIIDVCHSQNVPVIFSLNRQVLGRVLLKKVPVSIVGIFYYDGAQDYFKSLMILTEVARETYRDKFNSAREKFLLEKRTAKDEQQVKENLESTKVGEDKDETVDNNDDKNVQIKLAINEQVVGDEEKKIASDFAVIEENIESGEVEQDEDETIEYNEDILAMKEQIFRDEKKQIAVIEENIEWSEIQQDEDQTIENEDTNVQIQFAIYKQVVEDEEKPVDSDLAFVGEDIESSEIQQDKHETIENNEDTNVQTKPVINEQEVGDEKKQIASYLATELLERDKNKTIENNEDILAINKKIFGDNEKQITSDLAVVREDIESTEMGPDKDETIENNDNIPSKNEQLFEDEEKQIPSDLAVIQTGLETTLTNKDSFPDEEQQMTKDVEIGVQLSEIEEKEHQTRTENDDYGETKVESTG